MSSSAGEIANGERPPVGLGEVFARGRHRLPRNQKRSGGYRCNKYRAGFPRHTVHARTARKREAATAAAAASTAARLLV